MSVRYKFENPLSHYNAITFAGNFISLNDIKDAVFRQKKLRKFDCDLKVVDDDKNHEYKFEQELIPKNTRLIVFRIPRNSAYRHGIQNVPYFRDMNSLDKGLVGNWSQLNMGKEQEIGLMMERVYNRMSYQKENEAPEIPVPRILQCSRCYLSGHWVKDCPFPLNKPGGGTLQQYHIPRFLRERQYDNRRPNRSFHNSGQAFDNEKTVCESNNEESCDSANANENQE